MSRLTSSVWCISRLTSLMSHNDDRDRAYSNAAIVARGLCKLFFVKSHFRGYTQKIPDSKVHGAKMGPTWVLSAPDGSHVGPMNLAVRVASFWDVVHIRNTITASHQPCGDAILLVTQNKLPVWTHHPRIYNLMRTDLVSSLSAVKHP